MKKISVLQSNYFPWIGYFDLIYNSDLFVFYDEVKYTKNDWRNRNRVSSENGMHWITIPTSKISVNKKISDVTLDHDQNWRNHHLSLLDFCYRKAPFFKKQLRPMVECFLFEFQTNSLSELNQNIIKRLCEKFEFETKILNSANFELKEGKTERLLNLLENFSPCKYISGPAGKSYLEEKETDFANRGIDIEYFKYLNYVSYNSVPYMGQSILDYLAFNDIKNFKQYLNLNRQT